MQFLLALVPLLALACAKPTIQRRAATCGVTGYDKNSPNAYYFVSQTNQATCASLCSSQSSCNSFAYGQGNCLLYTSAVADNFVSNFGSPYVFNDISCVPQVGSVVSTAAAAVNGQTCGTATVTVSGSTVTVAAAAVTVSTTLTAQAAAVTTTSTFTVKASTVTVSNIITNAITVTSTVSIATTVAVPTTVTKICANPLGVGC